MPAPTDHNTPNTAFPRAVYSRKTNCGWSRRLSSPHGLSCLLFLPFAYRGRKIQLQVRAKTHAFKLYSEAWAFFPIQEHAWEMSSIQSAFTLTRKQLQDHSLSSSWWLLFPSPCFQPVCYKCCNNQISEDYHCILFPRLAYTRCIPYPHTDTL